jgi:membrane protein implicated in regulation of membrane protease activity
MADLIGVVLQTEVLGLGLPMLLLLAGVALVVMEAMAPGAHFIVVGVALLVAGLLGLGLSGVVSAALLPFVLGFVVLVVGAITFYAYRELDIYGGKGTAQTSDSKALTGSFGRVTERVTPTGGEIKLDDGGFNPYYSARSMDGDIEEGTEVMVIDPGGGNVVTVTPVDGVEDEIDRELARGRAAERDRDAGSEGTDRETETETE